MQVQHGMSPQVKHGVTRWIVRETMGIIVLAAMLFLAAGTLGWIAGWTMVIVMADWVIATALVVIPRYPELLAERTGPKKGAKTWDTALLGLYGAAMMIMWIVAGLDFRNGWSSSIGPITQIGATLIVIAAYALVVWATGTNAFFSQVVRIQTERGHTVISSGPYHYVRHPAYVGMVLVVIDAPIMLGSWWALIPGLVSAVLVIIRTALEDRTLQAELPGYTDYTQLARYRLLPGLW
ncbi:MAG TPA: isoprenylcysteine carboxylmethyltransferase family protein [Anaerolineae bacterium]|nr:isoprenylcysteine carboxylmethyltransferase family protein [Anaerolineae bacterium]